MKPLHDLLIEFLNANHETVAALLKLSKHDGDEIDKLTSKMLKDERLLQELGMKLQQLTIAIK